MTHLQWVLLGAFMGYFLFMVGLTLRKKRND